MKSVPSQEPVTSGRLHLAFLVAFTFVLLLLSVARAEESVSTIGFTDPSKPGTLKVRVWHGDLQVQGADVNEIEVRSDSPSGTSAVRKDGMRVLSASSGYTLTERNNVAVLEYGTNGWAGMGAEFKIRVPRSTSIIVANSFGGSLKCADVTGDIDLRSMDGKISLDNVTGGALVESLNGEITATVKSLREGKPLSFTSMNGRIVINVPSDLKADVRFRTHNGMILTDFDDKALVTHTDISHRTTTPRRTRRIDGANQSTGDAPATPAAVAPSAAAKAAVTSDHRDADHDLDSEENEVGRSIHEAAEEARMAMHEAAYAVRQGLAAVSGDTPRVAPSLPPLPPMTGGKIVSGSLNGGGVEIQASTLNGGITLKKI